MKKTKSLSQLEKRIKFCTYDGSRNIDLLLKFIRQFKILFGQDKYKEKAKIKFAALHLTDLAHTWWTGLEYEHVAPRSWRSFERQIQDNFFPSISREK